VVEDKSADDSLEALLAGHADKKKPPKAAVAYTGAAWEVGSAGAVGTIAEDSGAAEEERSTAAADDDTSDRQNTEKESNDTRSVFEAGGKARQAACGEGPSDSCCKSARRAAAGRCS